MLTSSLFYCLLFGIAFCIDHDASKPLVIAHWMPWFQYPSNAYHWPPQAGMYYEPIIGYYNTQNDTVMDWQLSLMEYVGIDGIIVDWYGTANMYDYPFIKTSTDLIWNKIQSKYPKLSLGICYDFNSHVTTDIFDASMNYLKDNYFNKPQYIKYSDNNPIMLLWPSQSSTASLQTPQGLTAELKKLGLDNIYVYMEWRNPAFKVVLLIF